MVSVGTTKSHVIKVPWPDLWKLGRFVLSSKVQTTPRHFFPINANQIYVIMDKSYLTEKLLFGIFYIGIPIGVPPDPDLYAAPGCLDA